MVICLELGADLHMAQRIPLSLASVKSRLLLPFWYRPTRVVPEKGPLNGCVCVVVVVVCVQICLHTVQLMPLPSPNPIISCQFQTRFTFLVPAYPGCRGTEAVDVCSSSRLLSLCGSVVTVSALHVVLSGRPSGPPSRRIRSPSRLAARERCRGTVEARRCGDPARSGVHIGGRPATRAEPAACGADV